MSEVPADWATASPEVLVPRGLLQRLASDSWSLATEYGTDATLEDWRLIGEILGPEHEHSPIGPTLPSYSPDDACVFCGQPSYPVRRVSG